MHICISTYINTYIIMDALRGFGELGLGSRLKRLSEYILREVQSVYDYFNIDFDSHLFPIIKVIEQKEGVTNGEICQSLNLTQPAITQAINKLIRKDLVSIVSDPIDKRKKIIKLSEKGETVINQMKPLWIIIDRVVKEYTAHDSSSLIEHLNKLEDKLIKNRLSTMIIEQAKASTKSTIDIIDYDNAYAKDFYELNVDWLKTYFYVEPFDEEVLSKPEQYIIDKGGYIFFAKLGNTIVGTVALMPLGEPNIFELTKMAVSPKFRGLKIGQQLMQHCIDFAKSIGLPKLMLYSNTRLENAIYIYRKYGFIEIPVEANSKYARSNIKMELVF